MKRKNSESEDFVPVAILMGSDSDWPTMKAAAEALNELGIASEARILSAHRTPEEMIEFGREAEEMGFRVLIAGAGGAAHLPGMLAAMSSLPVIGVPVENGPLRGQDALLSIVQMPKGVPVATVAIGQAFNAGLLAAQILGASDDAIRARVTAYKQKLRDVVRAKELG